VISGIALRIERLVVAFVRSAGSALPVVSGESGTG
jgi:hypothetical protein